MKRLFYDLYIHPDQGPITPVRIDLDEVDAAGESRPGSANDAMVDAIVKQIKDPPERENPKGIKELFKDLHPEDARDGIRGLLKYMNRLNMMYLSGIALRVPGTIAAPTGGQDPALGEKVKQLTTRITELTTALQQERINHAQTRAEFARADADLRQARTTLHQLQMQTTQASSEVQRLGQQVQYLNHHLASRTRERDEALQRITEVETRLGMLQHSLSQRANVTPEELSKLRREVAEAENDAKQLRASLQEKMAEIKMLKEELANMPTIIQKNAPGGGDPFLRSDWDN